MNKLTISLTIFAMAFAGCGDDDRPGDIVIPDSGPGGDDMGPGTTDMGPPAMDMGPSQCEQPLTDLVELNMDPMAMGMLLPRCAAATETCVADCADDTTCQTGCVMDDDTPGVNVGGGTVLDCNLCFNYQFNACVYDSCPDEFTAVLCCAEAAGCANAFDCPACESENMALGTCASPVVASCDEFQAACFADE
jgi:hypothetical protein